MPLIIHPSSCCDICLETLTYNEKPPFAIPCGHIFCRSCLFGLNPSLCPLCRKPFLPERSKKLITGDLEIPEIDGIEDKTAIELLKKLVDSLDTERHDSATLEVDVWLSAGNTHALLQKAHEVLKEFLILKSERSASLRSIRRLQREMRRLQVDRSTEKENASAMEQALLSQVEALREKVRKFEERPKAATTITFNHNPLPTPPEPFPLESLPFFANLQQNYNLPNEFSSQNLSDYKTQSMAHLSGDPANPTAEGLTESAQPPSTDQTSILSNPITVNELTSSHRNAIIPGASPNQRYIPRTVLEDSSHVARTSIYEQLADQVDPFALATDYFEEYAAGFQEGYLLNHRHLQSSSRRHRPTEPVVFSMTEPTSQSSASSGRPLDDRLTQQSVDLSTTSQPERRPFGLQDFYRTSTSFSPYMRRDSVIAPRVSSSRPSTPHDEQPWVPPNWPTLPMQSRSSVLTEPSATFSSSPPTPPSASASSNSGQSPSPPRTFAPPVRVTSTMSLDARSLRSSHISDFSSAPERRSSEISWDPSSEVPAPNTPDARPPRRSLLGVNDSPASAYTTNSWGTLSTSTNPNMVFHQPFIPAYQVGSVSDLGLIFFPESANSSHGGTISRRSSLLPLSSPHTAVREVNDNVGSYGSDSQNRTPRVVPRPLPETESVSSLEGGLPADRHSNISNTTDSLHRDLDDDPSQHHGTPSDASETWHRATADLTSIRSRSHTQSQSHSHSISGPVADHSSRTSRQRTSRLSSAATHNNPTSLQLETPPAYTNALGLTDLTSSPEPRISAPTPITPSRSFLRYYNENPR